MEPGQQGALSHQQIKKENEGLRSQLKSALVAMHRTQSSFHAHQAKSNCLTTSLYAQIRQKDVELSRLKSHQDRQIQKIVSHLLFLEGQFRKDQKDIVRVLTEKEQTIKSQQGEINELTKRNEKLIAALKDVHVTPGSNGFNHNANDKQTIESVRNSKDKNKAHKLKFSGMRDRLRRHRSSFELHQPEPLETLEESSVRSSSQENLTEEKKEVKRERRMSVPCKQRPNSMINIPQQSSEFPLLEVPQQVNLQLEDEVYDKIDDDEIFVNSCDMERDIRKSCSLPQDISRLSNGPTKKGKNRPHSMSSVDFYAMERGGPKSPTSPVQSPPLPVQTGVTGVADTNPFKSIKTLLKRKGSKMRNKKRSVSLPQGANQEYAEALQKHFQKYDLQ